MTIETEIFLDGVAWTLLVEISVFMLYRFARWIASRA